ncbi:MAG: elongation factor G [Lentisphaeria bacterium]
MKGTTATQIRNFTLAGHSGTGKTTLAELMLYKSGIIPKPGDVEKGTSVSDFRAEEKEHQGSIYAAQLHCPWQEQHFFFNDTPGATDFFGETVASLNAADAAVIVLNAESDVEIGAIRAWQTARDAGLPVAFFINRMDTEQAGYDGLLNSLQERYGSTTCIPFTVPIGSGGDLSGVVNVLRDTEVPENLQDAVASYKESLMDTIAESDEELMTKYLEGAELSEEEISRGLHQAIRAGEIIPVFAGSASQDIGVEEFMNGVGNLFPAPVDNRKVTLQDTGELECTEDAKASLAFVYKSVSDPYVGQMTIMRVFSGTLHADTDLYNVNTGDKERMGSLLRLNGAKQEQIETAGPGEILAAVKLKSTCVNHTISSDSKATPLAPIEFPKPIMSYAVYPAVQGEDEKINEALSRLIEEDPTLKLERTQETKETILSGLGEQQLQNAIHRMKKSTNSEVELCSPKVPYRETITTTGEASYRHKKQSGGHGQFAEVYLRVEPLEDSEFEFGNEVVGGNIPKNFIPAVEKGVKEAMTAGPLARCKVINLKAVVYDGKHHPVDSSEMAFKIASRAALREAIQNAKPQLLEPIMKLRIMFPEEYMGDITGDLNSRRGRILGMDRQEGMQVVNAELPLSEAYQYANHLRSLTHGSGSFDMEFDRYEQVPANVAKQIKEAVAAEEETE